MGNKKIAIHQPNLFPWLGYFYKMYWSDAFVLLDDVQMQKTGSNYTNRTSILSASGQPLYLTIPISRPSGAQLICDVVVSDKSWKKKFMGSLQANYAKSPFFKKNKDFVFDLIDTASSNLSEFNSYAIIKISGLLGISECKIKKSSDFNVFQDPTGRLIGLVKSLEGNVYISGAGGDNYQETELFKLSGIDIEYVKYPGFEYVQSGTQGFVKGLSVLDAIFYVDFVGVMQLLKRQMPLV